ISRTADKPAKRVARWSDRFQERVAFILAPGQWRMRMENHKAELEQKWALPRVRARVGDDPVDMVSREQGVVLLNRLNYRPRPVLQSYSTFTPFLQSAHADFFRGPRAPEYVLFSLGPIDGRLPTLEDGPALVELIQRYRPVLEEESYLLLQRLPDGERPVFSPGRVVCARTIRLNA